MQESGWNITAADILFIVDEMLPQMRDLFDVLSGGTEDDIDWERVASNPPAKWAEIDVQKAIDQVEAERRRRIARSAAGIALSLPRNPAFIAADRQTRDRRLDDLERARSLATSKPGPPKSALNWWLPRSTPYRTQPA